jgi:hypothetical protein
MMTWMYESEITEGHSEPRFIAMSECVLIPNIFLNQRRISQNYAILYAVKRVSLNLSIIVQRTITNYLKS